MIYETIRYYAMIYYNLLILLARAADTGMDAHARARACSAPRAPVRLLCVHELRLCLLIVHCIVSLWYIYIYIYTHKVIQLSLMFWSAHGLAHSVRL